MAGLFKAKETEEQVELSEAEKRMQMLDDAEHAIDAAFATGKADRAEITRVAQNNAREAVRIVGEAMEADENADEKGRLAVIAENMGDREKTKAARKIARDARRDAKNAHRAATKAAKIAYDAIKFSQPGKLGFMRAVQVIYAINISLTLLALLLTSRDAIVYDSVTIFTWVTIILQGVGFWFFINYFKVTKPFVIVTSAVSLVSFGVTWFMTGTSALSEVLFNGLWNIFLIVYFALSERVDKIFVNDFASYRPRAQTEISRKGWPFVRNLIIYFIVFSVLGHWMEAGMCQFIRLGLVEGKYDPTNTMLWRDWLYPYPMEGAAVVIIALLLYPLWQLMLKRLERPIYAYVLSFLANALTCGAIEFGMGLIVNQNLQLWDYRENFGNIMGQVCLQNVLAFGVAASIIAWVVYPLMERWIARIPQDTMNIVFVVVAVIGGILWSLYIIDPPDSLETPEDTVAVEVQTDSGENATPQPTQETAAKPEQTDAGVTTEDELSALGISTLQEILDNSESLSDEDREMIQQKLDDLRQKGNADNEGEESLSTDREAA